MNVNRVTKDELEDLIIHEVFKFREEDRTCRITVADWSFHFENQNDVDGWRERIVPLTAPFWARLEARRVMERLKMSCRS